jgi:hypothetical protein
VAVHRWMMCPRDRSQAFGAPEVGERFTGPGGELIHTEIRIGDSETMITQNAAPARFAPPIG